MRSRSVVFVSVAVWLCSLVAATWRSELATPAPADPPGFLHSKHVIATWGWDRQVETFRDCRGCHRFGADARSSSPQQTCQACHYGDGKLEVYGADSQVALSDAALAEADLSVFASRAREGFRHHTHGMLQCAECHRGENERAVLDDIPIRTGPGECARCHEASQAEEAAKTMRWFDAVSNNDALAKECGLEGAFAVPTDAAEYAKKLVEVFAGEDEGLNKLLAGGVDGGGDFTHGDHDQLGCAECHGKIPDATAAEVGTGAIDIKNCGECHQRAKGAASTPLEPAETAPRESWSLGAFAHADHYRVRDGDPKEGVCVQAAYEPFEGDVDKTCSHCHQRPEQPDVLSDRDYPFDGEGSKHRYQNCQECHDVPKWRSGESVDAPLHSSTGGDRSGWLERRCTECHVFNGEDMKAERPAEEVRRWTGVTFRFEGQTHPLITGEGMLDKDCSECHRARVEELPSRLIKQRFRHATHLAPGPAGQANKNCVECHKSAATARTSSELAQAYRTYDLGSCKECHTSKSAPVVEDVAVDAPDARVAVSFPHQQHVAHLACAECHELDGGGEDFVTKDSAKSCTQCHDHVSGEGPVAGLLDEGAAGKIEARLRALHHIFDDDVESCANCHHDPARPSLAAVPAIRGTDEATRDPRYSVQSLEFVGFAERQHHPSGVACVECHRANQDSDSGRIRPIPVAAGPFVRAEKRTFHAKDGVTSVSAFRGRERAGCMSCHWHEKRLSQYAVSPASREVRAKLGNDFEGWPGVKALGRFGDER